MTMNSIEILARLVAFDTVSRNSNLDCVDWTQDYLTALGFRCERFLDAPGAKANLLASIGPDRAGGYVLSGHTDVVPVDAQDWSGDPFELRRRDGRLYGRGTCDMKGFLAACLAAAPDMAREPLSRPIHLAFTYDEEVGCIGARELVRELSARGFEAAGCFVGEPTEMRVVVGHKGKNNVRVAARGLGGHSSLAPLAVNAVEYAAMLAGQIRRVSDSLAATGARDDMYDVPHSTGHVGVLRGGSALNLVPCEAELLFEFRTIPQDDADALVAGIIAYARDHLEPRMRAIDPATGFDFDVYARSPGLDTDPHAPVVDLAKRLSGSNGHHKVAFMTEAGLFQTVAGIPTVVIGPGSIEQAHTPDEWIAEDQLERCSRFIDGLIETCRSGGTAV